MEQKISVSATKLHTTMMPSKWTGYNYTGMSISVLTHLQNISLPYVAFPAEELYDAHVDDSSSKDNGDDSDFEPAQSFGQIHASYDTVKSFFYMQSTSGHNRIF
jgi:hypothetical protein